MNPELIHHLSTAATALESALPLLNTQKHVCECCGLTKKEDFFECQLDDVLRAMIDRLQKYAVGLERKPV